MVLFHGSLFSSINIHFHSLAKTTQSWLPNWTVLYCIIQYNFVSNHILKLIDHSLHFSLFQNCFMYSNLFAFSYKLCCISKKKEKQERKEKKLTKILLEIALNNVNQFGYNWHLYRIESSKLFIYLWNF